MMIVVIWIINEQQGMHTTPRLKEPTMFRVLTRKRHIGSILKSNKDYCVSYLKIHVKHFMHLVSIRHDRYLLCDTRHVSMEEQLAIFPHIIGYNTKLKLCKSNYYDMRKLLVGTLIIFYVLFVAFETTLYNLQDVVSIQA